MNDGRPPEHDRTEPTQPPRAEVTLRSPGRAFAAASSMAVGSPLPLFLIGTLAIELNTDLGMSDSQVGLAASAFFLGSSVLSMTSGSIVHRVGWRMGLRLAATASLISFVSIALFATTPLIFVSLLLIGCLAHALNGPAGNLAIATELPAHRLGLFFGLKQAANPVAGLLAGAAVPFVAAFSGWRLTFMLGATLPILTFAAIGVRRSPPSPAEHAECGGAEHPRTETRAAGPVPVSAPEEVRRRTTLLLALGGGFATASVAALGAFVVLSAVEAGVSQLAAGTYVMFASVAGLVIRMASGWWVDRTGVRPLRIITALLAGGVLAHLGLATGSPALVLPGTLLAYASGWGWPGLFMLSIARHFGADTARATGRMQAGMMFGGVVGPAVFTALQHRWGYSAGWLGVAVLCGAGALLVFLASVQVDTLSPTQARVASTPGTSPA